MSLYTIIKSPELAEILQFLISLSEWRLYNSPSSCIKCSGESSVVVVVRSIIIHVGVGFCQASTRDRLFVSIQTRITTLILLLSQPSNIVYTHLHIVRRLKNINFHSPICYPSLFSVNEYMCLKISCHWVPYQIDRWLWWSVFQTLETELSALVITYWDYGQRFFLFLYQHNISSFVNPIIFCTHDSTLFMFFLIFTQED